TARPLQVSLWHPALNPTGERDEVTYKAIIKDATWLPATPPVTYGHALLNAAVDDAQGPYPLVIFSHGFSNNAAGYSATTEHYASYGFIVLVPEHTEQFDPSFGDLWKSSIDRP